MNDFAADTSSQIESEQNYQVPNVLLDKGFYAIELRQGEMYDLGNIKDIPHFIFYDRASGIAVDVTAEVKKAPLLSRTDRAAVLPQESVEILEQFLVGNLNPETRGVGIPQGIGYFRASEVEPAAAESLRGALATLAVTKKQHTEAVKSFETASQGLLKLFGVKPEDQT